MACIGKISSNMVVDCGAPGAGFNRIQGAKLINNSDIASFTVSGATGAAAITRVAGAVGYEITAVNNSVTVATAMKSQDITPGAFDVTLTFKVFTATGALGGLASEARPMAVINPRARAELVAAVDHGNGQYRVYGLGAPLVCLEYTMDSTGDGIVTATYGVEDWQVGTTIHWITKAEYDALSTPQPAPEPQLKKRK